MYNKYTAAFFPFSPSSFAKYPIMQRSLLSEVKEWQSRPLKSTYAVIFMDGMVFKLKKDGIMQKSTVYGCVGVDMDCNKDVLSLHIGAAETSKYWVSVMHDLKARGVQTVLIFCTDNLKRSLHNRILCERARRK